MTTTCRSRACDPGGLWRTLEFASCYVYAPNGVDAASERSRLLSELLKTDNTYFLSRYAQRVGQQVADDSLLCGFFRSSSVLVPVPGSTVSAGGRNGIAVHLAEALLEHGVGSRVWLGIQRVRAVRKSATAQRGSRPTVATHFASLSVEPACDAMQDIVLIDDVVTKGRTLLAAAARLRETLPNAQIRAFALVRTQGRAPGVSRLLEPCVGHIRWRAGDARRHP